MGGNKMLKNLIIPVMVLSTMFGVGTATLATEKTEALAVRIANYVEPTFKSEGSKIKLDQLIE